MHKATRSNRHGSRSEYDLAADYATIKAALADASADVRGRAYEILQEYMSDVREKSLNAKESFSDYVAEKPLKSIGIAILAGLIFGYFWRK